MCTQLHYAIGHPRVITPDVPAAQNLARPEITKSPANIPLAGRRGKLTIARRRSDCSDWGAAMNIKYLFWSLNSVIWLLMIYFLVSALLTLRDGRPSWGQAR